MKLTDLKPITESYRDELDYDQGDELQKGAYHGEPFINKDMKKSIDGFEVDYEVHQQTVFTARDGGYLRDPFMIGINHITYIPSSYTLEDLEFQVHYRDLDKKEKMQEFYNLLLQYGSTLDPSGKEEYNTKILPVFKKDPMFVKKLFASIEAECNNLYQGEF